MAKIVELLVGVSALAGIATFLGFRTLFRRTVRGLGRKPGTEKKTSNEIERRTDA